MEMERRTESGISGKVKAIGSHPAYLLLDPEYSQPGGGGGTVLRFSEDNPLIGKNRTAGSDGIAFQRDFPGVDSDPADISPSLGMPAVEDPIALEIAAHVSGLTGVKQCFDVVSRIGLGADEDEEKALLNEVQASSQLSPVAAPLALKSNTVSISEKSALRQARRPLPEPVEASFTGLSKKLPLPLVMACPFTDPITVLFPILLFVV